MNTLYEWYMCRKCFKCFPALEEVCVNYCKIDKKTKRKIYYCFCHKCQRDRISKYRGTEKGRVSMQNTQKKMNNIYPEKRNARAMLNKALKTGEMVKPKECAICLQTIMRLTAHHKDYSKPLQVVWMCDLCHRRLDKILS